MLLLEGEDKMSFCVEFSVFGISIHIGKNQHIS